MKVQGKTIRDQEKRIKLQADRIKKQADEIESLRQTIEDLQQGKHDISLNDAQQDQMEIAMKECVDHTSLETRLSAQDDTGVLKMFWDEQVKCAVTCLLAIKR